MFQFQIYPGKFPSCHLQHLRFETFAWEETPPHAYSQALQRCFVVLVCL